MLKFLKVRWNSGLTITTAFVLGLLLLCLSTSAPADVTYFAQAVKWFDDVNVGGALTVADGIMVTAGGVDFPAGSVVLGDLQYDVVALGADVHTVCSSGCDYTGIRAALHGGTGSSGSPRIILVAPGHYTDSSAPTMGVYEYVVGLDRESTKWTVSNQILTTNVPGGLSNITLDGGSSGSLTLLRAQGTGHLRIENVVIDATPVNGIALWVSSSTSTIYLVDSEIEGGNNAGYAALYNENGDLYAESSVISSTEDVALMLTSSTAMAELRNCKLFSDSDYAIEVSDTSAVLDVYSTLLFAGAAESIHVSGAMTATICLCPMSSPLDGTLTNDCTNPYNPTTP